MGRWDERMISFTPLMNRYEKYMYKILRTKDFYMTNKNYIHNGYTRLFVIGIYYLQSEKKRSATNLPSWFCSVCAPKKKLRV